MRCTRRSRAGADAWSRSRSTRTGLARELDLLRVPLVIVLDRDGNVAFTSSRSDAAGLAAVATATDQIIAGKPVAAATAQGGKP